MSSEIVTFFKYVDHVGKNFKSEKWLEKLKFRHIFLMRKKMLDITCKLA